jgi:exodeoxyribonuclease VII large subunit
MTGNVPEWSVSELSGALKRTLEDAFGHVRLRGEISGYRGPHSSGHVYFTLKDASAKIEAVIWRGAFSKLSFKPQEGLEVIAIGKITTFAGKSSYQIVIEHLEPAGVGALMALLDERRRKLAAEGLFEETRKRPLPYLPRVIGVITSPTGAVIRDILHRLHDRFARHVVVWPVRVQGETSAQEVVNALNGFNALPEHGAIARPDVLLIARGGGSLEDLWSFNEEAVIRAIAASTIPVISAIGHETDWTLTDMVADKRAPTPTGAAEMVVPVRAQLIETHRDLAYRHTAAMTRTVERARRDVKALTRAMPSASSLIETARQSVDMLTLRLDPALLANARRHEERLQRLSTRLKNLTPQTFIAKLNATLSGHDIRLRGAMIQRTRFETQRLNALTHRLITSKQSVIRHQRERLAMERTRLNSLYPRLKPSFERIIIQRYERIKHTAMLLDSLSHKRVLARGYVIVRDEAGALIRQAAQVSTHPLMTLTFADGDAKVSPSLSATSPHDARAHEVSAKASDKTTKTKTTHQGDLF